MHSSIALSFIWKCLLIVLFLTIQSRFKKSLFCPTAAAITVTFCCATETRSGSPVGPQPPRSGLRAERQPDPSSEAGLPCQRRQRDPGWPPLSTQRVLPSRARSAARPPGAERSRGPEGGREWPRPDRPRPGAGRPAAPPRRARPL